MLIKSANNPSGRLPESVVLESGPDSSSRYMLRGLRFIGDAGHRLQIAKSLIVDCKRARGSKLHGSSDVHILCYTKKGYPESRPTCV
jgi:hypothetical protein